MGALTVRNLEDDIVRRLRIRAAEHGRSAEAEHREILRSVLTATAPASAREQAAERLAEFRQRTARRGSSGSEELLNQSRTRRTEQLLSEPEDR